MGVSQSVGGSGVSAAVILVHLMSVAQTGGLYTLTGAINYWEPLPVVPHRLLLSIDDDDDDDGDSECPATPKITLNHPHSQKLQKHR